MIYEVVYCSECGKPLKSVPAWLGDVTVRFSCEACRQKHPRPFSPLDGPTGEVAPDLVDDPDAAEIVDLDDGLEPGEDVVDADVLSDEVL